MSKTFNFDSKDEPSILQKQQTVTEDDSDITLPNKLLDSVRERLAAGDSLATIRRNADGSTELTVYELTVQKSDQSLSDASGHLNIQFPLPPLMTVMDFFYAMQGAINAIDNIYSIYALVYSGSQSALKKMVECLQKQHNSAILDNRQLYAFLNDVTIDSLRIVSFHYGSPASIDLLGIGKVIEVLKDAIKDLVWRGSYEKAMSELEQRKLELEITSSDLQNREKLADIALKNLEVLEKAMDLELADADKRLIVTALLPQMHILSDSPAAPQLEALDT